MCKSCGKSSHKGKALKKVLKVPSGAYIENGKVVDPYKQGSKTLSKLTQGIRKGYM